MESTNSKRGPFADDLNIDDDYYLDMIKDSDNLEPTDSKMGPFADDSNIDDDFYLTNWGLTKGQLISEWPFDLISSPKKPPQKFDEFLP